MLKIGVPYRYVDEDILNYFSSRGFKLGERVPKKFFIKCKRPRCGIYLLNATMLTELVEEGLLDLAIVQSVDFNEAHTFAVPLLELGIPVGRLMLSVKKTLPAAPFGKLPIRTVLTRTPLLTKQFLEKNKLRWKIREVRGTTDSVSNAFGKNVAVVEYVRTGRTMDLNGLVPVAEIAPSTVIMITHPNKVHSQEIKRIRKTLASPPRTGLQRAPSELIIYSKPVASTVQ